MRGATTELTSSSQITFVRSCGMSEIVPIELAPRSLALTSGVKSVEFARAVLQPEDLRRSEADPLSDSRRFHARAGARSANERRSPPLPLRDEKLTSLGPGWNLVGEQVPQPLAHPTPRRGNGRASRPSRLAASNLSRDSLSKLSQEPRWGSYLPRRARRALSTLTRSTVSLSRARWNNFFSDWELYRRNYA